VADLLYFVHSKDATSVCSAFRNSGHVEAYPEYLEESRASYRSERIFDIHLHLASCFCSLVQAIEGCLPKTFAWTIVPASRRFPSVFRTATCNLSRWLSFSSKVIIGCLETSIFLWTAIAQTSRRLPYTIVASGRVPFTDVVSIKWSAQKDPSGNASLGSCSECVRAVTNAQY